MKTKILSVLVPFLIGVLPALAANYSITQPSTAQTVECSGFMDTIPPKAKINNISESTFRNNPPKYYDLTDQGQVVIIKRGNGSRYQLIKL